MVGGRGLSGGAVRTYVCVRVVGVLCLFFFAVEALSFGGTAVLLRGQSPLTFALALHDDLKGQRISPCIAR